MSDDDKPGVRRAYQADYKFWLQKDQWDVAEAAMLLAGFEPEALPDGDSNYSDLASQTDGIHRLIADDISAKKLSFKNSPGIWIAWFKQTGLPLPSELDAVLLRQNHQTPPAVPVVTVGSSADVTPARAGPLPLTANRKFSVNKAALIAQHKHEWPTIERDLQDASTNGLSQAAKARARDWYEAEAVEWARSKNKLTQAGNKNDSLTSAMHTLPGRKHIMKG